jgi:hypothetical protein
MAGYYYFHTTYPTYGSQSSSILEGSELAKIQTGFDKLPTPTGYGTYLTKVNTAETALVSSNVSVTDAGVMTVPAGLTVSAGIVDLTATTPKVPTAAPGTNTTQAASTAFVAAQAFSASLPALAGNNGKVPFLSAGVVSWSFIGTANQMIRVNAAGTSLEGTLIGTASQSIRVNAGGTALEGYTPLAPTGSVIYLAQTAGGF